MALDFPNINPVIINVYGPFSVTWYSLAYVIGILGGWAYFIKLTKFFDLKLPKKFIDDIATYTIIGIIIGGRLGYVLFYDFKTYYNNPLEILATWRGGMSFHGGLLGLIVALYVAAKTHKLQFLVIMDLVSCVAPIGIFFGRIANFINAELYGKVTNVPWGILFPNAGILPRHPSQLYEAALEGIVIFAVQYLLAFRTKIFQKHGILCSSFLIQYTLYRSLVELVREPDAQIGYIYNLTMGQILSFPMLVIAFILVIKHIKKKEHA